MYEIRRCWWFPFVVSVWKSWGTDVDWKGREYETLVRTFDCCRRSTAKRWVEAQG